MQEFDWIHRWRSEAEMTNYPPLAIAADAAGKARFVPTAENGQASLPSRGCESRAVLRDPLLGIANPGV
ncbi:MAG: hypothetical protein F9K16_04185 [Thermoanaerobaculia bacterium]|jgi:hypothetical protein|nr:MAG: hypothetical protein F9K16_04185 [Thermoanaerobaculia bacterium]MBZ0103302.1 hypothetical protein [Thermoanaerobaculia bacterium]